MNPFLVTILIAASSILTIVAVVPYAIEVVRRKTKPRIVTWLIWTVLTAISAAAALSDHQYATGVLLVCAGLATLSIVVLGWRFGEKNIERLDIICFAGALVGLALWALFHNPALAIIAAVAIDLLGGVPTWVHIWKKPNEETAITFVLSGTGALCTLLVTNSWAITAIAYPLYLAGVNIGMAALIYMRRRIRSA